MGKSGTTRSDMDDVGAGHWSMVGGPRLLDLCHARKLLSMRQNDGCDYGVLGLRGLVPRDMPTSWHYWQLGGRRRNLPPNTIRIV